MPNAPLHPCRYPGCPALVDKGYCSDHAQVIPKRDYYRGSPESRGYDADWKRLRLKALERDSFLCVLCQNKGILTPAKAVDHIIPIVDDPSLRLVLNNLQSLCPACHALKTHAERRANK